jgi:hypothetical protein
MICFLAHPIPLPLTGRLRKRDNLLRGEGRKGVGEEPNHTTATKLVPILLIQNFLVLILKGIIHDYLALQTYLFLVIHDATSKRHAHRSATETATEVFM